MQNYKNKTVDFRAPLLRPVAQLKKKNSIEKEGHVPVKKEDTLGRCGASTQAMRAAEITWRLGASGGRRSRALESARRFLHGAAMHD